MNYLNKIELLAPVGSIEALNAAVGEGADAVYLGLKDFNARLRANNFTYKQIDAIVDKLHQQGKKVYIALNILFEEKEMRNIYNILKYLEKIQVDAVIIQDISIAQLARLYFPQLKLHASTQMNVSSSNGVNFLSKQGFSRIVLGRELNFEQVQQIKYSVSSELEIFVHGALCICVSGICQFSSYLGGKSANRGCCTQPCRRIYDAENKKGYYFSPNDLMLIDQIPALMETGIDSIKIEGRMRSADYVANAVKAYRYLIDHYESENEEALIKSKEILKNDFARDKTSYLFVDSNNSDFVHPDQSGGTGVYLGEIQNIKENSAFIETRQSLSIDDSVRIHSADDQLRKTVKIKQLKAVRNGYFFNIPEEINVGDFVYLINIKSESNKYSSIIPKSVQKYHQHPGNQDIPDKMGSKGIHKELHSGLYVRISHSKDLFIVQSIKPEKVILTLEADKISEVFTNIKNSSFRTDEIIFYLIPYFSQNMVPEYQDLIDKLISKGYRHFVLNNYGHFSLFKKYDQLNLICGPFLYTFNSFSIKFFEEQHCNYFIPSFELNKRNLFNSVNNFNPGNWIIPVYGYPELFQMKNNLDQKYHFNQLYDKFNSAFNFYSMDHISYVLPEDPFCIFDKINQLKKEEFNKFLIDFSIHEVKKNQYKTIIKHFDQREFLVGSKRYNWKDGFYQNKK